MVLPLQYTQSSVIYKVTPCIIEHIQKYIQKDKNYTFVLKPILNEDYPYIDGFEFNVIFKVGRRENDKTDTL